LIARLSHWVVAVTTFGTTEATLSFYGIDTLKSKLYRNPDLWIFSTHPYSLCNGAHEVLTATDTS
jgi:hypothetical protein